MGALAYINVEIVSSGPCPTCGIEVTMPSGYLVKRRDDGAIFYCVNGHQILFKKTEADKLREQLATDDGRVHVVDQLRFANEDRRQLSRQIAKLNTELEKLRAENDPSRVAERQREACVRSIEKNWVNAVSKVRRTPLVTDALKHPDENMWHCLKTGNPCGTDTWMVGYECPCTECQAYLRQTREKDAELCAKCGEPHAMAAAYYDHDPAPRAFMPRTHVFGGPNNTCLGCGKASGADDDHEQECPAHGDPVPPGGEKEGELCETVDSEDICAKCGELHYRGGRYDHDFEPRAADVSAVPPSSEKDAGPLCYWCGHARSTHDADGRAVRGPAGDHVFASTFTKVTTSRLAPADAPIKCDFGDKCPGHASSDERPCEYDPSEYVHSEPVKILPAWRFDVTGREIKIGDKVYSTSNEVPHEALEVVDFGSDRIIVKGGKAWRNTAEFGSPHLRIVDAPTETVALDEWTDAKCDELADFAPRREWKWDALVAIKRRNARIAELEEQRRLSYEGERRTEAALATAEERARHLKDELRDLNRRDGERLAEYQCRIQELESALAAEKGKEEPAEAYGRGYRFGWSDAAPKASVFNDSYSSPEPRK